MAETDLAPELPSPPRDVRLRTGYRVARVALLLLLIVLPSGFLIDARLEMGELQRLVDNGVMVQGRVEGLRTQRSGRSSRSHHVSYSFEVGAQRFAGSTRIGKQHWERLSSGMAVEVCYWSVDPRMNRFGKVTQIDVDRKASNGWLVACLVALVLGGVLYFLERILRRNLALLGHGRAVIGQVVGYESFRNAKKKAKLAYRFQTPASAVTNGLDRLSRKLQPPPEPGAAIVVLQSRDDSAVFATLPRVLQYGVLRD